MFVVQDPNYSQVGGHRTIGDESVGLTPLVNPLANQVVMGQGERVIVTTVALTAPRTLALGSAASYGAGAIVRVVDAHRGCTVTNTLTGTLNGTDHYNAGTTSPVIIAAGGKFALMSDGIGTWVDA